MKRATTSVSQLFPFATSQEIDQLRDDFWHTCSPQEPKRAEIDFFFEIMKEMRDSPFYLVDLLQIYPENPRVERMMSALAATEEYATDDPILPPDSVLFFDNYEFYCLTELDWYQPGSRELVTFFASMLGSFFAKQDETLALLRRLEAVASPELKHIVSFRIAYLIQWPTMPPRDKVIELPDVNTREADRVKAFDMAYRGRNTGSEDMVNAECVGLVKQITSVEPRAYLLKVYGAS
jgi:hypothetical protein